jgi:hypothetical protein
MFVNTKASPRIASYAFAGGRKQKRNKMTTREICNNELTERINTIEDYLKSAKQILKNGELLQSAVRLQEIEKHTKFDELILNVFDSVDRERDAKVSPQQA